MKNTKTSSGTKVTCMTQILRQRRLLVMSCFEPLCHLMFVAHTSLDILYDVHSTWISEADRAALHHIMTTAVMGP